MRLMHIAHLLVAAGALITGTNQSSGGSSDSMVELRRGNPEVQALVQAGRISRLYGPAFSSGDSVLDSADSFLREHADVFGVDHRTLRRVNTMDGLLTQPVYLDPQTGDFRFEAVYYEQVQSGLPVFGSRLALLVRNEPGYPLVLAVNRLQNFIDPDEPVAGMDQFGAPPVPRGWRLEGTARQVVFHPGLIGQDGAPRAAWVLTAHAGVEGGIVSHDAMGEPVDDQPTFDRRLFVIDAATGRVLFHRSRIHTTDVTGNVSGYATDGLFPDSERNPPVLLPIGHALVDIFGGNSGATDASGDYVIVHDGSDPVTVQSRMYGPSLTNGVDNFRGDEIFLDQEITPPGPADFVHNDVPAEDTTAQVNAMKHTGLIHTWLGNINPLYPGLERDFLAIVNADGTCNAFYAGDHMTFYAAGNGCPNMAYTTVVYHEYGHKIVDDGAFEPTSSYHEGMADTVSIVLTDDPIVGQEFFGEGSFLRTGENNLQYPCVGEGHHCGQVLSGCVWHTREFMKNSEPNDYVRIMADLTINSVLLHSGDIDPGITIDFLTLDDDDANILNGTPHYEEIDAGFSMHNMPAPPLEFLYFDYDAVPNMIDPAGGTTVRVTVSAHIEDPVPGTGELYYNAGDGWMSVPMVEISDNVYDAVFPATDCGQFVEYYFAAQTAEGNLGTDPPGAPTKGTHSAMSARYLLTILDDNFETDQGWRVVNEDLSTGPWERGVPAWGGNRVDPEFDYDGSGQCYITGNSEYGEDVDGGPTHLISPRLDLRGGGAFAWFAYWVGSINIIGEEDPLEIYVSDDDGQTWAHVATYEPTNSWHEAFFSLADFVALTDQVRIRFSIADNPDDSVAEGGVDAVFVQLAGCGDLELVVDQLVAGEQTTMAAQNATPDRRVYFIYSLQGLGSFYIPQLDVTVDLQSPQLAGYDEASDNGLAVFRQRIPNGARGLEVWLQAVQTQRKSNVINGIIE